MPPSEPAHGVGPAPRHGVSGNSTWAQSVVAISNIPNPVATPDLHRITEPPPEVSTENPYTLAKEYTRLVLSARFEAGGVNPYSVFHSDLLPQVGRKLIE